MLNIRPATEQDRDAIWDIFHAVIAPGDTYAFDPEISQEEALAYWFRTDTHTYVAENDGRVVGTCILKPNQPARFSHRECCLYGCADRTRAGVGREMGEHCLNEARRLGFRAMQFNFVVSTNEEAIRLWKHLGFKIVGTLPAAFRHREKGYVDVYIMFRSLL